MIGMVYKDFLVLRRQLAYYVVLLVLYAFLTVAGAFPPSILSGLVVFLAVMMPMSSLAYDEQARWDCFAVSTPAGRGGVVGGKYLFSLLVIAAGSVIVLALQVILALTGRLPEDFPLPVALLTLLACAGIALILDAALIPLLLRFGTEKSRLISTILLVAVIAAAILAANWEGSLPFVLPPWLPKALPGLLAILAVGGFAVSYCISRKIYAEKAL